MNNLITKLKHKKMKFKIINFRHKIKILIKNKNNIILK